MADPDHDGIPNLLERALGQNPTNGGTNGIGVGAIEASDNADSLEVTQNGIRYLAFAFTRPAGAAALTDVTYAAERSSAVGTGTWSSADVVVHSVTPVPGKARETVIMRSTHPIPEANKEFLRLRVSLKP